jgi:hypothetical protein
MAPTPPKISSRVPPFVTVRINPGTKELALVARGTAALVLASAFGVGLLVLLVKVVW